MNHSIDRGLSPTAPRAPSRGCHGLRVSRAPRPHSALRVRRVSLAAACAAGPPRKGAAPAQPGSPKPKAPVPIGDLVTALSNRNPEPVLVGRNDMLRPLFARDYDWREQERVRSSVLQLLARAEEAIPESCGTLAKSTTALPTASWVPPPTIRWATYARRSSRRPCPRRTTTISPAARRRTTRCTGRWGPSQSRR